MGNAPIVGSRYIAAETKSIYGGLYILGGNSPKTPRYGLLALTDFCHLN